jgi:carbonic anhydrase/acetyltransferase-like protein (isoleucine patch superfamily)
MDISYRRDLVDASAFVAGNATIVGDVRIAAQASIWFGCVLRAEHAPIVVGSGTNIQDLSVVHSDVGKPCVFGDDVTVGHRAVVHSATVGDNALIGIGAIVLDGCRIGRGALIGAGAVVPEGTIIPPHHLALGVPARLIRVLTDEEIDRQRAIASQYVALSRAFLADRGATPR